MIGGFAAPALGADAAGPQPPRPRQPAPPRRAGPAPTRTVASLDRDRQPAARARDRALLHLAAHRRALRPRAARPGAARPLRHRTVRRRRHRRRRHRQSGHPGARESGRSTASSSRAIAASRTTRSRPRSGSRRARSSPARAPAPTSPGSSSSIAARAATPPASSRRSSSSTRTASTSCSRSTRGRKSRVRRINIIGNEQFGDGRLISEMATREHVWCEHLQLARHLRSRPARLRPAEAAAILPDPGLCRFPRRLGGRRADPGPARLHHHLRGRGGRALQVRRRRGRERHSRLQRRAAAAPTCRCGPGDWYNAQQVEDTVTQLNELAGLFGYAFADVRPQFNRSRENLTMGGHLPGRRDAARLCRADRHQRQHHHPRQGDPPRIPARRGRSVQQRPGPPLARPHPVARLLPGKSGDPAGRRARRPTASSSASRSRSARPASSSFRPASRASSASWSTCRSSSATSWAAARSCAPRSIIRAIPSRSSSASPSPICSTATSRSASTSSGATSTASTSSATTAPRPIEQITTGGQIRMGVPLTEQLSARAALRPQL